MYSDLKGFRTYLIGLGAVLALGFSAGKAYAQAAPPDELVLKAKVRDFVEANATVAPSHPHFLGNKPFTVCSAQQLGVDIAAAGIDTTDDMGDTSVFKGDNRGPRLLAPLDPRAALCYEQPSRFSDWYNDRTVGDVNRPFLIDIRFVRDTATGVYEYADDTFFPLDQGETYRTLGANGPFGNLLPAPNNNHDFGFTMEFHARFTYFKGRNQVFKFRGDDDVWVFVNGKKAIELGGIHPSQDAAFNLDSIAATHGLKDSLVYPLDFFFAERHTGTSMLRISTTLELEPVTSPPALTPGRLFEGSMTVAITHTAADATLYFTTDGSVPTAASPKYTGPFEVSATATVKAIAVRPGFRPSDPVEQTYTRMETVATPRAVPPGRTFTDPIQVVLTDATPGAVIHYTLNGDIPDATSPVYTGPLVITATTTIKARAYLTDWVPSAVMTEIYTDAGDTFGTRASRGRDPVHPGRFGTHCRKPSLPDAARLRGHHHPQGPRLPARPASQPGPDPGLLPPGRSGEGGVRRRQRGRPHRRRRDPPGHRRFRRTGPGEPDGSLRPCPRGDGLEPHREIRRRQNPHGQLPGSTLRSGYRLPDGAPGIVPQFPRLLAGAFRHLRFGRAGARQGRLPQQAHARRPG
jgi:fibro-slime domain-containing protein